MRARSTLDWSQSKIFHVKNYVQLEIRSVERGICPIATLYSLAAAYKG